MQRVSLDGQTVWSQISWKTIEPRASFQLPANIVADEPKMQIEIDFTRLLWIRRFRVWIADELVYDEVNG